MKVRSEILLIIAIIFIAIIGGASAGDTNQSDDVVSISDDSSLVDVPITQDADDSVTLNESSDIEEDSSDTNDELAGTDVAKENNDSVLVSNSNEKEKLATSNDKGVLGASNDKEVLSASNDNEVLGATLASLQTEVDNARKGDTLSLTQNYVVGTNTADWAQIVINKNLEIRGRNGNQYAYRTLDANGRGSIISITGTRTVTFRYIIFQNAGTGQDTGGAIYVAAGSTVIFDHCIFNNNVRRGDGAAINVVTGGTYTFTDCEFNGNYASGNGGVIYSPAYTYYYGYQSSNTVLSFTNCKFDGNSAGGSGAVVYATGAALNDGTPLMGTSATFENCDITNNAAGTDAALYLSFRTVSINNCDFEGNTAYKDGGAIHVYRTINKLQLTNSNFINNQVTSVDSGSEGRGGAFRISFAPAGFNINNCLFDTNSAMYGGAVYTPAQESTSTISNSRFYNNVGTANGGAIYCNANGTTFYNNEFTNNKADNGAGIFLAYSVYNTVIDECTFTGNEAISEGGALMGIYNENNIEITDSTFNSNSAENGGAISLGQNSNDLTVDNCQFSSNHASNYGGSIYFERNGENIEITDTDFNNNFASSGGAILLFSSLMDDSYNNVDILNCNFNNNNCTSPDGRYGGSAVGLKWAHDVTFDNCLFNGNNASANGAIMIDYCYDVNVNECDFTNNYAGRFGGAFYAYHAVGDSDVSFTKCSFEDNTAMRSGGAISTTLFSTNYENLNNVYKNWIITDCDFTNNNAELSGGALYIPWTSNLQINNVPFTGNTAGSTGAMYWSGDKLTINDVQFTDNEATTGDCGALFIGIGSGSDETSTVSDITFENNNAYGSGGAISGTASNVDITNVDFNKNSAWYGGAIYWTGGSNINIKKDTFTENHANNAGAIDIYNTANVNIEESSFVKNTATVDAGAIWFNSNGGKISNCEFTENTAGGNGAAVILDSSSQTLTGCTFTDNIAGGKGGAIYDTGVGADNSNTISESTFTRNEAYDGGAVYVTDGRITKIYNDTFIDNIASHNGGAAYILVDAKAYVDYDLFKGDGIYRTSDERQTWNVGARQVIYSSLFQKSNLDYYMNASALVQGLTAIITVNVPTDANRTRNGKVVFDITFRNSTHTIKTQYVLDNFDESGIVTLNLPSSEIGNYSVIVSFSEDTYLYKQVNLSYIITDPRGDFEILQGLINDAIANGQSELVLTRSYTFTPGNSTHPLDFGVGDIEINAPLIINGNGWTVDSLGYSRIFVVNGNNVVIKDLTLVNGNNFNDTLNTMDSTGVRTGGGAILWNGANGVIDSCVFSNDTVVSTFQNTALNGRGGAVLWRGSNATISNSVFENNSASMGGAVAVMTSGKFINSNFTNNTAAFRGGSVALLTSPGEIIGCEFHDSSAYSAGALLVGDNARYTNITDSVFDNNTAQFRGGAIAWGATYGTVTNTVFNENTGGFGGAICFGGEGGSSDVTGCTFTNNEAKNLGGAINLNASRSNVKDSKFINNSASYGGGIFVVTLATGGSVVNLTFINNTAVYNGGAIDWNASSGNVNDSYFENNHAGENGGALFCGAAAGDEGLIYNSIFISNSVDTTPSENSHRGGAIYFYHSAGEIELSKFRNNSAYEGGAVFVGGDERLTILKDSEFTENVAIMRGGAVSLNETTASVLNCIFNYNNATYGGGISVGSNATGGSFVGSTFIGNIAKENGGAINLNASRASINDVKFINNSASYGGALFVGHSGGNGTVSNITCIGNTAIYNGGAIDWNASTGNVSDSHFYNNTASNGGAIFVGASGGTSYIYRSSFTGNNATNNGGAIDWYASGGHVYAATFTDNHAGYGGAVFVGRASGDGSIINSTFTLNTAVYNGGAVDWNASRGHLYNSTFSYNEAAYGGAIFVGGGSDEGSIYNSTFTSNKATYNGGAIDWNASTGNLDSSRFYYNTAHNGGAVFVGAQGNGGYIINSEFVANSADLDDGRGGAVDWFASAGHINASTFTDNTAYNGGAVFVGTNTTGGKIIRSAFTLNSATYNGGAIDWNASRGALFDSEFTQNSAAYGGAIFVGANTTGGQIVNSSFTLNTATQHGGAIDWNASAGSLKDSTFTQNSAAYGGAVFVGHATDNSNITNSTFTLNTATYNGGAIDWNASRGSLTDSKFYNNSAYNGGAVFVGASTVGGKILNSTFAYNTANSVGGRGGAIDWNASSGDLEKATFIQNSAAYGGAVFVGQATSNSRIVNSTFRLNSATRNGGAIDWNASRGELDDSVFDQNTANFGGAIYVGTSTDHGYIKGSNFTNNVAVYRGGAIDWNASSGNVSYSMFENNQAMRGGAIFVGAGAQNGAIYYSNFTSNKADEELGRGGAIYFNFIDNATVVGSNFTTNTAEHGGAIYVGECSDLLIDYSNFVSNSADYCGAVHWEGENGNITYSVFTSNTATYEGGAVGWKGDRGEIHNSTFSYNTAGEKAGALMWFGNKTDVVYNTTFIGNEAREGGAIYLDGGDGCRLYNATFTENIAYENGGAMFVFNNTNGVIENATFNTNKAPGRYSPSGIPYGNGGAISLFGDKNLTLYNLTFNDSFAAVNGGAVSGNNVNDIRLINLKFTNSEADKQGGSISFVESNNLTMNDIEITGSTAHDEGGAIYLENVSSDIKDISIDQSTSKYASAGAIYAKGNVTITNATMANLKSLNDVATAILFDGGNSTLVNASLENVKNAVVINEGTTVHLTTNDITDSENGDYAVLNNGVLYLEKNNFDDVIINAGIIETQTYTVVLNNQTLIAAAGSNPVLNASIVDDNNNTIVVANSFKFHDLTSGKYVDSTYSGRYNYGTYESVQQGKYVISASDVGLKNNTVITGTLLVKANNNIDINITQINEGDKVTIKAELVPSDAQYPYEGNISFVVDGVPYTAEIIDGVATLELYNVSAGTYSLTTTYPGDEFHFNSTNSTYFIVNLKETLINISVDNILYGQNATAIVTTNANGTVVIMLRGSKTVQIINGTAKLNMTGLNPGDYEITVFYRGNEYYAMAYNTTEFTVYKNNAVIDSIDFERVVGVGDNNLITVTMGNVTSGSIVIEVNGLNFTVPIVNKVAKLNVTLPVGKDYAVKAFFTGDLYFNATNKTADFTFEVTDKNVTVIEIESVSVIEVDGQLLINITTNTTAPLNVTVNGNPVTLDQQTKQFVADTSAVGTYMIIVTSEENNQYSSGYNSTIFTVIKHNSSVNITVAPTHYVGSTFTIGIENNTNVTVTINGKAYAVKADGTVDIDTTTLEAGEYIVSAVIAENDKYYGNSSTATFNVIKYNATIDSVEVTPVAEIGQNITVVVTMGNVTSGNVLVEVYGWNYTVPITDGVARLNVTTTRIGNNFGVNAYFLGDSKYNATSKAGNTFNVTGKYPTVINITVDSIVEVDGELIVTITSNTTAPLVVEVDGNPVTLNSTGQFVADTSVAGTHTIVARSAEAEFYTGGYNSTTFNVIKHNSTVNITVGPLHYVEDVFTITIGNNTNVTVTINGKTYSVKADGTVDIDTTTLTAGEYVVSAVIAENDKYYGNSTSATFNIVKYNAEIVSVNATPAVVADGQSTTFTVTFGNVTTGTVEIEVNGQNYTTPIVDGVATLNLTLPVGKYTNVTAYFLGDYKYNATNKTGNAFEVTDKNVTYIIINVANIVEVDDTVIVTLDTNTTADLIVTVNGQAVTVENNQFVTNTSAAGTYTIIARADENEHYSAGYNSTVYTVIKHNSTVNITVGPVHFVEDAFTIKIGNNTNVTVTINGRTYAVKADGTVDIDTTTLEAGEYVVSAVIAENDKYYGNSTSATFNIVKYNAEIVSVEEAPVVSVGQNNTIVVTMGNITSGEITIEVNGQNYTVPIVNSVAKLNVTLPIGKDYPVKAYFLGDYKHNATSMAGDPFEVTDKNVTIIEIESISVVEVDSKLIINVTTNSSANLIVTVNGKTAALNRTGQFIADTSAAGTYTIVARTTENQFYSAGYNSTVFTVVKHNSTVDIAVDPVHYVGDEFTINVTSNTTVTVTINGKSYEIKANGNVNIDTTALDAGEYTVTATVAETDKYYGNSSTATFNVVKYNAVIESVVAEPMVVFVGQNTTITVTMANVTEGIITIEVNGQNYTVPIVNKVAKLNVTLPVGNGYTVTAYYLGDRAYNATNKTGNTFDVTDKNITVINITVASVVVVDDELIVTLDTNTNATLNVTVNGKPVTLNATKQFVADTSAAGTYTIVARAIENEYYSNGFNSTTFTVIKHNSTADVVVDPVHFVGDEFTINVTSNTTIAVTINGKTYEVVDGTVVIDTTALEAGEYTVVATVTENDKYYGNSSTATFKVVKYNATITSVEATPTTEIGQNITVVVTMGNVTEGSVLIEVYGLNYTVPIVDSVATLNVTATVIGDNFSVNAYFLGDNKHNATEKAGNTFNVTGKYATVITIDVESVVEVDGELIVTIKTNSTSPLNVTVNGQPVTLNSTGQFIADTSVVGTYTIIATTEEGAFYYGGFNSTTFTVIKHNATVNVTVGPIHYVEDVFTVNITNNTAVNVTINGKTYAVKADGTVDIDTTALEAGEYTVVATVTENDKYYGNSSTATFNVIKYNATIESVVAEPMVVFVGQNTTITVTMANVTEGVVTIEVNGQNYTANIVNKVAKLNVTLPVGKYSNVTAYFLGDYKYNATNNTGNAFEVTDKNVTVINITVASVVVVDDELIVTIETNTNATLNVTVNGKPVTLNSTGQFVADTSVAGTYTIVARAIENEYYSNGFNSTTFTVIKHNSTVDISVDPLHTVGDNFAIIVTSNTTVTVTINGKEYSIDSDGAVIIDTTALYAGEYIVTATVAESDKYYGNTSTKIFTVSKLASKVNVTVESIVYGNDTEIIVKVPTGQDGFVTITVGGQNYTDEIKNGEVRFVIAGLDVDTYTVDVAFLENGKYNASTNSTTFEVTKANLTAKVIANNITVLDNSTFIVSVDPNFKGNVSITVDGVTYDGGVELLVDLGKLAAGDKTASVKFYGDDNYDNLTMDVKFTVSKLDSPINVVHDGKGIVTVVVPENATGNVTITVDGKTFNGTIENGAAVIYLENVSSGEYNITVTYPGDDKYKNATLNTTIEIKKLSTPISVNVTNIYVGDVETIVVSLPDDATGNVTISVDGKSYTQPIVNGNATFAITDLTYGNKTVAVSYIGDAEYDGNFTSANFTVSKRQSYVNVDVEATTVGSTVTINVEIPANATGLVVISVDGTNYTVTTTGGKGSVAIPGVGNTTHTVKVTYLGDEQYLTSSNETTYGLAKVDSSVKVEAEDITFGDREVITVTVPSDATGNVTVEIVGVGTSTVAVANGTGVLVVKDLAVGDYNVKVTYNGDGKYKTSAANETTFKVSKIETKEIDVIDQGNGTVVVIVPGNGTGNVTITVNGTNYTGPVVNGTAVITLENATPGENNITVIYSGDENHTGITKNATVIIPKYDTPIKVSVGDIYVGDITHVVVELPENATGSVTIEIDGKSYTNSTIVAGKATFDVEGVLSGNKTVIVTYAGDSNYTGNFTTGNFTVSKRNSTVNVTVDATNVGSTVTVNVEIPTNATGIVVVSVDGTNYTVSTNGGKGKLEFEGVGNATHTVEVTYMGDDQYLSSTNSTTYGLSKVASTITVEAQTIYKGDVEELVIKVSSGATGNVTVKIGDEYVNTVGVTDGTFTVLVQGLTTGEKTVQVTYNGDAKYLSSTNETTFRVLIKDAVILSNNVTAYYNQTEFAVRLADTSNNPIAGETVSFTINGQTYTAVTDEYGDAKISLVLPLGTYTIETSYTDALGKTIKENNTIEMLSSIRASDLTRGWNSPYDYMAVFLDGEGHVLVNKEVSFIVNGKTYNVKTDAKGIALLDTSKLSVGKHEVTLVNNVTGEKTTRTTTIVARIIENHDIVMDFVDGTYYVVRVIGDDGKPVGEGEIIDMYANTIHYVGYTDKDGYARLKINLNPKTYKLTAEYKQYKVANKLVVKQTLKLVKKTVKAKKGKKFVLKAKLKWSNGKAIKGKKIVFKFKGKKYSAKTNSKGVAKVTIKKKVSKKLKKGKKYKYSATYITNIVKGKVKVK